MQKLFVLHLTYCDQVTNIIKTLLSNFVDTNDKVCLYYVLVMLVETGYQVCYIAQLVTVL